MDSLMSYIFLPCIKVTELIEKRNFEKLSFIESAQLEMHKKMCKPCRSYEKESVFIDKFFKENVINSPVITNNKSSENNILKSKVISNNVSK